MKVKKIKIGIKSVKAVLEDFASTAEAIEKGEKVKSEKAIYFESIEGFRKALTVKRLELLHIIKEKHPESINELARFAGRDIKNIATDVKILESLDLIDMKKTAGSGKKIMPTVEYSKIGLEIAV
jgi:predicted transcriptional regulator